MKPSDEKNEKTQSVGNEGKGLTTRVANGLSAAYSIARSIMNSTSAQILVISASVFAQGSAAKLAQVATAALGSAGIGSAGMLLAYPLLTQAAAALVLGVAVYAAAQIASKAISLVSLAVKKGYNALSSVVSNLFAKKDKAGEDSKLEQNAKPQEDKEADAVREAALDSGAKPAVQFSSPEVVNPQEAANDANQVNEPTKTASTKPGQ